jgi:citrate lyase beta subunit
MYLSYFITPALGIDALYLYTNLWQTFVVIDLADSIHMRVKQEARQEIALFDFTPLEGKVRLGVRINPITTIEGVRDVELLYGLFCRGGFPISHIIIPQVKNTDEMSIYASIFASMPSQPKLIPVIDTSEAVDNVEKIAALSDAIMCGDLDLVAGVFSANQRYIDSARTNLCIAAAKRGIVAIDTNSYELENMPCLETECVLAKSQGFTAKAALHLVQVPIINSVFAVPEEEIVHCRGVINEYEASEGSVVVKRGRLVVSASAVTKAKRILEFYDHNKRDE